MNQLFAYSVDTDIFNRIIIGKTIRARVRVRVIATFTKFQSSTVNLRKGEKKKKKNLKSSQLTFPEDF